MGRILGIDYGRKRCGIAVTDILQITANGLPTVRTCDLMAFLKDYIAQEKVDLILVGKPIDLKGNDSECMTYIKPFLNNLQKEISEIPIVLTDERFTSVIAHKDMLTAGFKKSSRLEKGKADEMAAVIMLNDYLSSRQYQQSLKK